MQKRYLFVPENRLRLGLLSAFSFLFSLNLAAQTAPVKSWDKTFGGTGTDGITSLQQTSDGGYILGGSSNSGITGDKTQAPKGGYDYWLIKTDASGTKIWEKAFGGSNNDYLNIVKQTSDGGYLLGGYSNSPVSGDKSQATQGGNDFWLVKTDASGNKLWDKTFGTNGDDVLSDLLQNPDGTYIIAGSSDSGTNGDRSQPTKGSYDYWILKVDANGTIIWDNAYGGTSSERFRSLQQTADGGYIFGGYSSSPISGDKSQNSRGESDFWIVKTDASGTKTWDKTFGGSAGDYLYSLQQTADGGYILGGYTASPADGDKTQITHQQSIDFWVVKTDASGTKTWDRTLGGDGGDFLNSLLQTADGGYLLGGYSDSEQSGDKSQTNLGTNDFWLLKLNSNGTKIWDKTLGGSTADKLFSLKATSDGGYILGGNSASPVSGEKTQGSQGFTDFWVIKLAGNATGLRETEASFNLSISPNPNQGKFNLHLSNLTAAKAEVTISDLLGRVVLQKELQTNNNQLSEELILPNAKGIYLLQLKAGEQIITRKIVVE